MNNKAFVAFTIIPSGWDMLIAEKSSIYYEYHDFTAYKSVVLNRPLLLHDLDTCFSKANNPCVTIRPSAADQKV